MKHFIIFLLMLTTSLSASYKIRNGELVPLKDVQFLPVEEHYRIGLHAFNERQFDLAIHHLHLTSVNDAQGLMGQESLYYLGFIYYSRGELDIANDYFTQYLQLPSSTQFFYDAVNYKFSIAEQFRSGAKRRMYGTTQFPKWMSGLDNAIEIYDEIACIVPTSELATLSLYYKGCILKEYRQHKEAIDAFQLLITRFPKHELASESYLMISKTYIDQAQVEQQNPDIIELSRVNLKRFAQDYPQEPRLGEVAGDTEMIQEIYAHGLYETAQFYERIGEPQAAIFYYQRAILSFPETKVGEYCCQKLEQLSPLAYQDVLTKMQQDLRESSSMDETFKELEMNQDWESLFKKGETG